MQIRLKPSERSSREPGYRTASGSERNKDSTFECLEICFRINIYTNVESLSRSLPLAVLYRVERIRMSTSVERFDERARLKAERVGRDVVHRGELLRHPVYTRVLHWLVEIGRAHV